MTKPMLAPSRTQACRIRVSGSMALANAARSSASTSMAGVFMTPHRETGRVGAPAGCGKTARPDLPAPPVFCTLWRLSQRNGTMSSPRHASIPAWSLVVPLLASALLALKFTDVVPADAAPVLTLAGLLLAATVFAAVHHTEVLAQTRRAFGSILLA